MATVKELKEKAKEEQMDVSTENLSKIQEGIALTEGEMKLLTELSRKKDIVAQEVSYLAQQQLTIDYRQEEAEKLYRDNIELEKQIGDALTTKYGNGRIDLENGVFIPA
jgi:hypothetical protein